MVYSCAENFVRLSSVPDVGRFDFVSFFNNLRTKKKPLTIIIASRDASTTDREKTVYRDDPMVTIIL